LLAWNELLTKDVKGFCLEQLSRAGFSPYDLIEAESQRPPIDPRLEEAMRNAEEAKRMAEEYKTQIETQKQQALHSQVEAFKDGKDSTGQTRRQFVQMYAPQINDAVAEIQAQTGLPLDQALYHAYEYVMQNVRGLHQPVQSKVSPVQSAPTVKKAMKAASSVTGAPASGTNAPKPRAKTIEEAMDRAEEKLAAMR
jgi:predicted RNase H-like HicB family nuclease